MPAFSELQAHLPSLDITRNMYTKFFVALLASGLKDQTAGHLGCITTGSTDTHHPMATAHALHLVFTFLIRNFSWIVVRVNRD